MPGYFTKGDIKSDPLVKGSVLCNATFCVCACVCTLSRFRLFGSPWTVAHQAPLSIEFPSKNTGVGCHFLLQGIFPTQGSNPSFLHLFHWKADSLPLRHKVTLYSLWLTSNLRGWYSETSDCFLFLHQFIPWFQHPLLIQGVQITVSLQSVWPCMAIQVTWTDTAVKCKVKRRLGLLLNNRS